MAGLWASGDVISMARMNQKTVFIGATAPTTTYAGQNWYNTQSEANEIRNAANTAWLFVNQTLTQITTPVTAPFNATTTLMSYAFGANALQVGQTIILEGWCNEVSSAAPATINIRCWWNAVGTILAQTGAITPTASFTGDLLHFRIVVTVITTTSVECQGIVDMNPAVAQTFPLRNYVMNTAGTVGTVPNTATIGALSVAASSIAVDCVISNTAGNTCQIRAGYIKIM